MNKQERWTTATTVESRKRFFGHRVMLDLSDFFQRINYFTGCWPEMNVIGTLALALRPGDAVIDGGANIGLVLLFAAGKVGPRGSVDSFDPMPTVFERLGRHTLINSLAQIRLHSAGLSDAPGELELRLPGEGNQVSATFSTLPGRYGGVFKSMGRIPIVRGDDQIDLNDTGLSRSSLILKGSNSRLCVGCSGRSNVAIR